VAPFTRKRAGLVLTTLPGAPDAPLTHGEESQRRRMAYLGGEIARVIRVAHERPAVAESLRALLAERLDLILVLGASAITDRKDVVPAAIEAAGGTVEHLGITTASAATRSCGPRVTSARCESSAETWARAGSSSDTRTRCSPYRSTTRRCISMSIRRRCFGCRNRRREASGSRPRPRPRPLDLDLDPRDPAPSALDSRTRLSAPPMRHG
jgi:hypothetical protein